MLENIKSNPSLICHLEISFSFISKPLSEKCHTDGFLKHHVACRVKKKVKWHPYCQLDPAIINTALLQPFNKNEAAAEWSSDIKQKWRRVFKGVRFVARTGLWQTKPMKIDGCERSLPCFLSLLILQLGSEFRARHLTDCWWIYQGMKGWCWSGVLVMTRRPGHLDSLISSWPSAHFFLARCWVHSAASSGTSLQCLTDKGEGWRWSWCSSPLDFTQPAFMTCTYFYLV